MDAATDVLLRDGAQALTLDAVARQAQVSKGGLLYHFPSKQALVAGMVDRLVGHFDAALTAAGETPGAATRVYLQASVEPRNTATGAAADRATAALFAASIVDPDALRPLREVYQAWQRRLENDGIDPAVATAVRLAVDGWWLSRLVDLAPPAPGLHERVYVLLTNLIDGS
nr:TetR/AcrR family transcriptional regulator [Planosporangium thailandense]